MGKLPTRKCIGRKTLVNKTKCAGHGGVGKLRVELGDLRGEQQAFIDDGARRQRRNIKHAFILHFRSGNLGLCALANYIQFALEGVFRHTCGTANKNLLNVRLGTTRHATNCGSIARGVAPAQDAKPFFAHDAFKNAFTLQAAVPFNRQKHHARGVSARLRQCEIKGRALAREKCVRNLNQNARAVARLRVAATRTAVRQIDENLNPFQDNVVAFFAANAGDKSETTCVVFIARLVEPLRVRETVNFWLFRHGKFPRHFLVPRYKN